jgi:hypothetical protein
MQEQAKRLAIGKSELDAYALNPWFFTHPQVAALVVKVRRMQLQTLSQEHHGSELSVVAEAACKELLGQRKSDIERGCVAAFDAIRAEFNRAAITGLKFDQRCRLSVPQFAEYVDSELRPATSMQVFPHAHSSDVRAEVIATTFGNLGLADVLLRMVRAEVSLVPDDDEFVCVCCSCRATCESATTFFVSAFAALTNSRWRMARSCTRALASS